MTSGSGDGGRWASLGSRRRAFVTRIRPGWLTDDVVRGMRWGLIVVWLGCFLTECLRNGVPFDREGILLWMALLAAAASFGKRSLVLVLVDFLPLVAVLVVYDYLRGLSDKLGMPTWWYPQIDADRFLFAGHEPTIWLQEHLKHADVRWYDVMICLCYYSFYFLPYITAGVLWIRRRSDFYRWSLRFSGLSFLGFALFALVPAAPPWAAALCGPREVARHPHDPECMELLPHVQKHNILGQVTYHNPGANPFIERIVTRGFSELHLQVANAVWTKGREVIDQVAAFPSLHIGGTTLFVLFMWKRVKQPWWKPILFAYPFVMTFTLVYSGEHYVVDCLGGALGALIVHLSGNRIERWYRDRTQRRAGEARDTKGPGAADTLEGSGGASDHSPESLQESQCPPSRPLPETTPSST